MQKMIYIPEHMADVWDDIEKTAKSNHRGIGIFLCLLWEKSLDKYKEKASKEVQKIYAHRNVRGENDGKE